MSTYRVTRADGSVVSPGDLIKDFRGHHDTFVSVSRPPAPLHGREAKITIRHGEGGTRGQFFEYYASVYGLAVVEVAA